MLQPVPPERGATRYDEGKPNGPIVHAAVTTIVAETLLSTSVKETAILITMTMSALNAARVVSL